MLHGLPTVSKPPPRQSDRMAPRQWIHKRHATPPLQAPDDWSPRLTRDLFLSYTMTWHIEPSNLGIHGGSIKVIIQIPCFNEGDSLPATLKALPTQLLGVDQIERLVVDDGSTDHTQEVAVRAGVEHIVRFPRNRGLAKAFMAGIDAALAAGADIIVNTDADNQYDARDIQTLIQPILDCRADFVIGERPIEEIAHFSPLKKVLQRLGSRVVRWASGVAVPDAPSGFRALSREAALQINVFSTYSYTLETLIQAGRAGIITHSVPIRVNPYVRPSRLMRTTAGYLWRSSWTILQVLTIYRPFRFFGFLATIPWVGAAALGTRYLALAQGGEGKGHIQSLILAVILSALGTSCAVLGVLAELIATNRRLLEEIRTRTRRTQFDPERCSQTKPPTP